MTTLSCMVLYKNERVHLERLLPKITAAFDDIVLVTNREPSTDGSDELVTAAGLTPHRMDWHEDFAEARQFGLDRCRGDYKMWMDCDDDLVTSRADWASAKRDAQAFLAGSAKSYYTHRIYVADRGSWWTRENWFHRDAAVRVKYPTHELYFCSGSSAEFPAGIIDRVNAPLRPDYPGKLWRYFDMLHKYLRDVDPRDVRCKFYLAREFRGPAVAQAALYLDYWQSAVDSSGFNFYEEWHTALTLFNLRAQVGEERILRITEQLLLRHPFELLSHALYSMARCELRPTVENAERFYQLLRDRARYATEHNPGTDGWYFDRALNWCGYQLFKISVHTGSRELAEHAVEILAEGDRPGCHRDVADLIRNNRKLAQDWLSGFRNEAPSG